MTTLSVVGSRDYGPQIHRIKNTSTVIYAFKKDGTAKILGCYRPHWDGAPAIWRIIEQKYLPPFIPEYVKKAEWYIPGMSAFEAQKHAGRKFSRFDPGCGSAAQTVFDLVEQKRVPVSDRIVLATTLDDVLVHHKDFLKVAQAFREFPGKTNLLPQAYSLEYHFEKKDIIAVGWGDTESVNNWDVKGGFNEATEKGIPYNCLTMKNHRWLFEDILPAD